MYDLVSRGDWTDIMSTSLIKEYRGNVLDNQWRGSICVVDAHGRILTRLGDMESPVFYRSAAKPIQVLPFVTLGLAKEYGIDSDELALTGASHLGEPFHLEIVERLMKKTGFSEEDMVMAPGYPHSRAEARRIAAAGLPKRRIYHNCSGKHLALLSIAKKLDDPAGSYYLPFSKTGILSTKYISAFSGCPVDHIKLAIDGCGVPVFAVPLPNMALSYLRLACPKHLEDDMIANAAELMGAAYTANPSVVRGYNTLCEAINRDPNLMGKLGAGGVYCIGMRREEIGIALKVEDGSVEHLPMIVTELLRQLNYHNDSLYSDLNKLFTSVTKNERGDIVGQILPDFKI